MIRFATLAELAYVLTAILLGLRLVALFLRRGAPTGLLGIALLFGGAPVHGLVLALRAADGPPSEGLWQIAYALLYVAAGVAGTCVMRFTHEVFRPRSRWLPVATGVAAGYFAIAAATLPFGADDPARSPLGLGVALVLGAIFGWASGESFAAWAMYRRAPGLDPLVVDRFRLWGVAALSNVAVVGLFWAGERSLLLAGLAGLFGMVSSLALWLAFLPPPAYARRLRAA